MNKEKLEEALKVVKEPITVNSIEYKYFDIENYNKLVNAIDYCNYLNANVKPYVEAQDKEIEKLNNIINGMEKFFKYEFDNEVRPLGSYKVSVWTICLDKLKELKEGK